MPLPPMLLADLKAKARSRVDALKAAGQPMDPRSIALGVFGSHEVIGKRRLHAIIAADELEQLRAISDELETYVRELCAEDTHA